MIQPPEIFKLLNREVIGQDAALREMAVAIYKHLISHRTGNVLLIGNSGTGKTTIMRSVERFFAEEKELARFSTIIRINANLVADLATKGAQSNVVMERLARQATTVLGNNATKENVIDYTAHGIVCVDEVDKIRAEVGGEPSIKGIIAQDSLLTLMENENVHVKITYIENGSWQEGVVPINTAHVLFIAGGAFEELYGQVLDRVTEHGGMSSLMKLVPKADGTLERRVVFKLGDHLRHEDLFRYGMTPQFIARFASIIMLGDLSPRDLVSIFCDIPHAIWPTAQEYFAGLGINLQITEGAKMLLADKASENNRLGARALTEVFGRMIKQYEYNPLDNPHLVDNGSEKVLTITEELVKEAFK